MSQIERPRRKWTYQQYWDLVIGAQYDADGAVDAFNLVPEGGVRGMSEWLGEAEEISWANWTRHTRKAFPASWGEFHTRAAQELYDAAQRKRGSPTPAEAQAPRRRVVIEAPRRKRAGPHLNAIRVLVFTDEDPDTSYLDQDDFEDRREAYRRGDFSFIGVRAEAEVVIEGTVQKFTSGGLWGIESDSGDDYIKEIAAEEYAELRKILTSVGVATSELPREIERGWIEWRV